MSGSTQEKIRFAGSRGGELAGVLETPVEGAPVGWALFAHCFTCSKDLRVVREIAGRLTDAGFGVLRFDFTGLGQSGGEFADSDFAANIGDLHAAAGVIRERGGRPGLVIGHSLGGAAALHAAGEMEGCDAVATIGAPFDPEHVTHLLRGASFDGDGTAEVSIGGRPFRITESFVGSLRDRDPAARIRGLGRALLVFHSPVDSVVGIEHAERIYTAARHPKSFVSLGHADHLLQNPGDARFCGDVLAAWARHQLAPDA
ncbi:MAG: alpha/beta hydrolase family protein [Phycisphaerales bacterium JB040]